MLQLSHKDLIVYKSALQVLKEVYLLTRKFPMEERFGLVSQLRRAAISVCSNIAEGSTRFSKPERKRFYEISRGSVVEIDTQFEIALLLGYINNGEICELENNLEAVFKMLCKMMHNLTK